MERFRAGADVVHTKRRHREGETALKMRATRVAYRIINAFSDVSLPTEVGDFKLLSKDVAQRIVALPEQDPYMRGLSVWVGFRREFVEYDRQPRFGGKTKFPLLSKGPIREFIRGLTAFSAAPLYFSFLLGIASGLLSLGLMIYALVAKFAGVAAPGSSGVLIALGFFSGAILVSNGLMGLYIARIYHEVKGRPRYIIRNVFLPPKNTTSSVPSPSR